MTSTSEKNGEQTLFQQLISFFPIHHHLIHSAYQLKKVRLQNGLSYTILDEEKTKVLLRELMPLNEKLREKNTISGFIEKLSSYTHFVFFIHDVLGILTHIGIDSIKKELELCTENPDLQKIEACSPSNDFHLFVDKVSAEIWQKWGDKEMIANKYLTYKVADIKKGVKEDSEPVVEAICMAYLTMLNDVDKDTQAEGEITEMLLFYIVEMCRKKINTVAAARWIGALFAHYYEVEYVQFLNENLNTYGRKDKTISVLDNVWASTQKPVSQLYWSKDKGAKIDLIRLLIALYDNKYFELENKQLPSKELLMREIGDFLHVDLKDYDSAFKHGLDSTYENNMAIFEKLKATIHKKKQKDEAYNEKELNRNKK